ncbi:BEM_collapsed_G0009380.mRNA.1.CDS.1 [Saccharomyces cerevisiae]|nr:BEM_collapsed_G0009380.mRNA.1.CDS.1 [Saccharomyces cerevisiae]
MNFQFQPKVRKTLSRQETPSVIFLNGKDDRLVIVIGPCSLHDPKAAYDYADRLAKISEKLSKDLLIIMRAYLENQGLLLAGKG